MPPWAALECERTGWTLDRIPTGTPSAAAASAARCPARPAPITRTSCVGKARASLWERVFRPLSRWAQRPAHLIGRDDPAQDAFGVNRHDGAELSQAVGLQERLERRL